MRSTECRNRASCCRRRLLKSWPVANPYHAARRRRVSAAGLAPTSGEVVTEFQSDSPRTDSPVRVLHAQPRSRSLSVRSLLANLDRPGAYFKIPGGGSKEEARPMVGSRPVRHCEFLARAHDHGRTAVTDAEPQTQPRFARTGPHQYLDCPHCPDCALRRRERKRSGQMTRTHSLPRDSGAKNRPPQKKGRPRLGS